MSAFHPLALILILSLSRIIAEPVPLFSIRGFNPDLGSDFALLGDAKPAHGGSRVDLTSDSSPSAGTLVFRKPLRLIDPDSRKPLSFSTDFVFSVGQGDGLALLILPEGDHSQIFGQGMFGISKHVRGEIVAVEFGARNGTEEKGGRLGVGVGRLVSDQSKDDVLLLNAGEKLQSWVDYEANSKRLEIRLNKLGRQRPYIPLISFSVDLLSIWGEREVLLGIGSSSQDSISSVYSWSFRVRAVPNGLHSMPLNPRALDDEGDGRNNKGNCALRILGGVIFATGCGTLVAFFVLLLWVVFSSRNLVAAVATPEIPMKHLDFNYQKVDVLVDDQSHLNRMS